MKSHLKWLGFELYDFKNFLKILCHFTNFLNSVRFHEFFTIFFSPLCKKYIRLYLYQSVNSSVSSTTLGCTFWVSSGCVYNPLRGFLVVVQVSILLQGVWLGHRFKKKIEMRKSKIDFYVKMKIFNFILLIICVTAVTDVMCNGNFSFVDKNHECFFLRQSKRTKSTNVKLVF